MDFNQLFEQLIKGLNSRPTIDPDELKRMLEPLCAQLRIAKISTKTYPNAKYEALERGEELISYDNGKPCVEAISQRIVTDLMAVIKCRVYIEEGSEPLTPEEKDHIRTVIETVSVYFSRSRIQEAAMRYAFYDDDGYHNLRYFVRHTERTAQTGSFVGQTAVLFNMKHFSIVNQQIGRREGSLVMLSFYKSLENLLGDNGIICRMGGDNFIMLFKNELLEEVLRMLSGTAVVYDMETEERIMVSATAGIFVIPEDFSFRDAGDIIDKVMSSSHAAKLEGKSDFVFYNDEMIAAKNKANLLQRLFPEALSGEEFLVYYQPKIDISSGELIGAEALCRWMHDGKLISPAEFIPLLEQSMDICKLDFYMLAHVCRDIRGWLDSGKKVVRISVNLSRRHMMDVDLLQHIIEIIDRYQVPHRFLEIELTETTTDVEFRDLKRVVSGLQQAGISTSVDDFGMGYSSLNLIKEIPWNVLKIDRSFLPIDQDDETSTRSVMFKYVIAMAKEMGLECIAEGVETEAQVNILKDNACSLAQGFFFDKPLPKEIFEKRLDKHCYDLLTDTNKTKEGKR